MTGPLICRNQSNFATLMQAKTTDHIKEIKEIFSSHLEQSKQRKTPERFAILEEIYSRSDHFDAETLYIEMKNKNFNVSRATVYNTLELLESCGLVIRHQFGDNQSRYEKSYNYHQHDHLICEDCKEVKEFCDPRIFQVESKIGELMKFKVSHHSLILYGKCEDVNCANKLKKAKLQHQ
jgi:Fur family transcriptional regulator, ferric uptake regulator